MSLPTTDKLSKIKLYPTVNVGRSFSFGRSIFIFVPIRRLGLSVSLTARVPPTLVGMKVELLYDVFMMS